jgi:hypothetical protein
VLTARVLRGQSGSERSRRPVSGAENRSTGTLQWTHPFRTAASSEGFPSVLATDRTITVVSSSHDLVAHDRDEAVPRPDPPYPPGELVRFRDPVSGVEPRVDRVARRRENDREWEASRDRGGLERAESTAGRQDGCDGTLGDGPEVPPGDWPVVLPEGSGGRSPPTVHRTEVSKTAI